MRLPTMYWYFLCAVLGLLLSGCASPGNHADTSQRPASDSSADRSAAAPASAKSASVSTTERAPAESGTSKAGTSDGAQAARVAGGVVGGAAVGALQGGLIGLKCGIGAIICSPVGAVIGAVAGGVTMGQKAAASYDGGHVGRNAGAIHPDDPQTTMDTFEDRHKLVGPFKGYGPMHSGEMYVNTTSILFTDAWQKRTVYLIVNGQTEKLSDGTSGGRSYIAEAIVDCSNSDFSIARLRNFSELNAMGSMVGLQDISPPLLIEDNIYNPDNALRAAANIVCKS
jgi:hypothetical protein